MGQSTTQQRANWKEFECNRSALSPISFGPDQILVAPPTIDAWNALASVLRHHGYQISSSDTSSYACRVITAGTGKSLHSYGIAVDINASTNPFKKTPDERKIRYSNKPTQEERAQDVRMGIADTDMTPDLIADALAIKTKNGQGVFEWGGNWKDRKDAMHFEIDVKPGDLATGINWATVQGADGVPQADISWGVESQSPVQVSGSPGELGSFDKCYPIVEWWENELIDDPEEPRGPTNMGITLDDLTHGLGHQATTSELAALTREDAKRISHDLDWVPINGDQLPLALAAICYHSAVVTGPIPTIQALQLALNKQGNALKLDGFAGPLTLAACREADLKRLINDFADAQDQYLSGLPGFPKYGKGWLQQIRDVREIALRTAEATRPSSELIVTRKEEPATMPSPDVIRLIIDALLGKQSPAKPADTTADSGSRDQVLQAVLQAVMAAIAKQSAAAAQSGAPGTRGTTISPSAPVLTPIDKMFPFPEFFAGKKTAIAIIAYVILAIMQYSDVVGTAMFPVTGIGGQPVNPTTTGGVLTTLLGGLGGMGLLSKFDRVVQLLGAIAGKPPIA